MQLLSSRDEFEKEILTLLTGLKVAVANSACATATCFTLQTKQTISPNT